MDNIAKISLICLPYAGGGSAIYHRWKSRLPPSIVFEPICLPGREHRIGEPLVSDITAAAHSIADEVQHMVDRPWAFLGHSMGALLGFELVRELRRRGKRQPALFIASASKSPHLAASERRLHALPDDEFIAAVDKRFQGIPSVVLENAELRQNLLPMLRADIKMVETYQYVDEPPLAVEILALGGTDDPTVSASQLSSWRRHTTGRFSSRQLPGGHFFLFQNDDRSERASTPPPVSFARLPPAVEMIVSRLEQLRAAGHA